MKSGGAMAGTLVSKGGWVAICVISALLCAACETTKPSQFPDQSGVRLPTTLAPGDVVKLSFPAALDLNQSQKIRADGKLSLPFVGEVTAAGKTVRDLQSELSRLYSSQLQYKEVVVTLESSSIPVYVSGAVGRPGKVVLERPMTIFETVMEAGGFRPEANPKKVSLVRIEQGQHHTYVLDLSPSLKGQTAAAFYLKAYDVIYVPESVF